jgi:NAD(P)-dependent dehydrogenase (short-subunit alcohol dehydrogenase family)
VADTLNGRIALVTGASGALGGAIARELARRGARVTVSGRNRDALAKLVESCGPSCTALPLDVTDVAAIRVAVENVGEREGGLDILVTAHGVQVRKPALNVTERDWQAVIDGNLRSVFFCCQAAGRIMVARGRGRIINITSLTAEIGIPGIAPYAASKGGVLQITRTLAGEWASHGVTVNAIGPGRIETPMTADVFAHPGAGDDFLRCIPMNRPGQPSDVAVAAAWLASDDAGYITGQTLYVDGGWLATGGNPKR